MDLDGHAVHDVGPIPQILGYGWATVCQGSTLQSTAVTFAPGEGTVETWLGVTFPLLSCDHLSWVDSS